MKVEFGVIEETAILGFKDLTDAQLEAAGFGRDELEEGLRDMAGRFGVSLL